MLHEVISLNFGGFANYVGAHYWNIQDELLGLQESEPSRQLASDVDSVVLYREGETPRGQPTYTPRLVLFDASGSLGGITARGSLYEPSHPAESSAATWEGRAAVHRSPPVPKSDFIQRLEEEAQQERAGGEGEQAVRPLEAAARDLDSAGNVRYFTDFMKAQLHPRSVHLLDGVWQGDASLAGWGDAGGYFSGEEHREAASERIRGFAEECDSLGGFQCFVDDTSAWGKVAADVLQEVGDSYGSSCKVVLFALRPSAPSEGHGDGDGDGASQLATRRRRLAEGLSTAVLTQRCDVYVPVTPPAAPAALPLLRWQRGSWFHESALCAAALDTATLPYRLAHSTGSSGPIGATDMWALSQLLTSEYPSTLAALSMALPVPALPSDAQAAAEGADSREEHLTPGGGASATPAALLSSTASLSLPGVVGGGDRHTFAECVVLRGARAGGSAAQLEEAAAALDASLLAEGVRCVRHRALTAQPLPVPLPFPNLFAPTVSSYGDVLRSQRASAEGHHVASCPVLVRMAGSTALGAAMQQVGRHFNAAAAAAQGQAMLDAWGYGAEERGEAAERLLQLGHAYDQEV